MKTIFIWLRGLFFGLIFLVFFTLMGALAYSYFTTPRVDAQAEAKIRTLLRTTAQKAGASNRGFDLLNLFISSVSRSAHTKLSFPGTDSHSSEGSTGRLVEVDDLTCIDETWLNTEQGRKGDSDYCRTEYHYEVTFTIQGPEFSGFDYNSQSLQDDSSNGRSPDSPKKAIKGTATVIQMLPIQFRDKSLRTPPEGLVGGQWFVKAMRVPAPQ